MTSNEPNPQPENENKPIRTLGLTMGGLVTLSAVFKLLVLLARIGSTPSESTYDAHDMERLAKQGSTFTAITIMQGEWKDYLLARGKPPTSIKDLKEFMSESIALGKDYYSYNLIPQKINGATQKALGDNAIIAGATFIASPKSPELSGVTGVIYFRKNKESLSLICVAPDFESEPPTAPVPPTTVDGFLQCPDGSTPLTSNVPPHRPAPTYP